MKSYVPVEFVNAPTSDQSHKFVVLCTVCFTPGNGPVNDIGSGPSPCCDGIDLVHSSRVSLAIKSFQDPSKDLQHSPVRGCILHRDAQGGCAQPRSHARGAAP